MTTTTKAATEDVLDWLNAPDDRPWPPPPSKAALSKIVEQVDDSDNEEEETNCKKEEQAVENSENNSVSSNKQSNKKIEIQNDDEDDDEGENEEAFQFNSHQLEIMQRVNMLATFSALTQLSEAEHRNEILSEESDCRSDLVSLLMLRVFLYVRDKEQGIIYENNRKLIANDLISELVAANKSMRGELGQFVSVFQQLSQQQQQGGGGNGKKSLVKETF